MPRTPRTLAPIDPARPPPLPGADAFASVLISHGVHSLRSPFFRDATGGVRRLSRALANHSFAAKFAQKLKEGTGESPPAPSSPPRRDGSMPRRPPRAR